MRKIACFLFIVQTFLSVAQTVDSKGKKQGYWKKTDEKTKKLLYEGEFKDDAPIGKFKYYYPNDSVRAVLTFKPDGKTSYAKLFHMTGKPMAEGKYINKEIKDSIWTYYDESGVLISRDSYKKGKKDGVSYVYLPEGPVSQERNYRDDLLEGTFKDYFTDSRLKAQGKYTRGQMEGRVSYYFPNGVEVAAGYYKNGLKTGPWIYKTESGKIKERELYKNGKLASQKETEEFFTKTKTAETGKTENKKQEPNK